MEKPAHLVLVSYFDDLFSEDSDASGAPTQAVRPPRAHADDTVVPFAPLPSAPQGQAAAPGGRQAVPPLKRPVPVPQYLCFSLEGFALLLAAEAVQEVSTLTMPAREGADWLCGQMVQRGVEPAAMVDVQALMGRAPLAATAGDTVTAVRLREQPAVLLLPASAREPQREALANSAVTWRGEHGARPWLAGTVRARRAIVLDPAGLGQMLQAH